jgi:hypothetical protein
MVRIPPPGPGSSRRNYTPTIFTSFRPFSSAART